MEEEGRYRKWQRAKQKKKKVMPKEEEKEEEERWSERGERAERQKKRGQEIKGAREDKMFKSDVREEGRGRDLLEERLSQVVPGQSLIRFKSN